MKIIDKTPFQTETGEISVFDRLQGTLKYGPSWHSDLEAQKIVIDQLNRTLEKGFVLIRNLTLPGSQIVEPIILVGAGGIYVIHVTPLKGQYEAKGDQWNVFSNGRFQPAPINLMSRVARLAKVMDRYFQVQGIEMHSQTEPVLIATDPGMHIDSMRPAVRVVQSDAIKQFATSLIQAPPVLRYDIYDLADRIVTPRPKSEPAPQTAAPANAPASNDPAARAHAIFNASGQTQPADSSDINFALQDETHVAQNLREPNPAQPLPRPAPKQRRMSLMQWFVLGFILLVGLCGVSVFGYLIFFAK
jgi:hypothetical protein